MPKFALRTLWLLSPSLLTVVRRGRGLHCRSAFSFHNDCLSNVELKRFCGRSGNCRSRMMGHSPGPRCKSKTGRQNQDRSRRSTNHRRSWLDRDRSWNATRPWLTVWGLGWIIVKSWTLFHTRQSLLPSISHANILNMQKIRTDCNHRRWGGNVLPRVPESTTNRLHCSFNGHEPLFCPPLESTVEMSVPEINNGFLGRALTL